MKKFYVIGLSFLLFVSSTCFGTPSEKKEVAVSLAYEVCDIYSYLL